MRTLFTATALAALMAAGAANAQSGGPSPGGRQGEAASPEPAQAHGCSPAAGADLEASFAEIDADRDGTLTAAEYARCQAAAGANASAAPAAAGRRASQAFAELDADGDGKIAKSEWSAGAQGRGASSGRQGPTPGGPGASAVASSAETIRRADAGGSSVSPSATSVGRDASSRTAEAGGPREAAPAAGAETTRSSAATSAGSSSAASAMSSMTAQELIGRDVVNTAGREVGEIDDIVIDERSQAVYAIVGVGGFLGIGVKSVAVPFERLRLGADNVILMSERGDDELKNFPAYKKGQWKSVERGQTIEPRQPKP